MTHTIGRPFPRVAPTNVERCVFSLGLYTWCVLEVDACGILAFSYNCAIVSVCGWKYSVV